MDGQILFNKKGTFHDYVQVIQQGPIRYLRFGEKGGRQGAIHVNSPTKLLFAYQRAFSTLASTLSPRKRFLSLGVGTGTSLNVMSRFHPNCELYGVEIDKTVIDAAISYFQAPSHSQANYWIGDGVDFLCRVNLTYDFIFVDAYLKSAIYQPIIDPDFVSVLDTALDDNGIVACNLITKLPATGNMKSFLQTANSMFPGCYLLPVGLPYSEQNVLAVFSRNARLIESWKKTIHTSPWLNWFENWTWPYRLTVNKGKI